MADLKDSRFSARIHGASFFAVVLATSFLFLFPAQHLRAATSMTLLRQESLPVAEGQTIIRSHYLYEPPAVGGVRREPTTITQELIVVGCGVNYDVNRGIGQPSWAPSQAALAPATQPGVVFAV